MISIKTKRMFKVYLTLQYTKSITIKEIMLKINETHTPANLRAIQRILQQLSTFLPIKIEGSQKTGFAYSLYLQRF